jgi:hypothetical protein
LPVLTGALTVQQLAEDVALAALPTAALFDQQPAE